MSTKVSTPFYKTLVNEAFAAARERFGSSHKEGARKLHELLEFYSWVRVVGKAGDRRAGKGGGNGNKPPHQSRPSR